jgi:hypothetical protein
MDQATAEALAGPFFGVSLLPYLAFLYFLNQDANRPNGNNIVNNHNNNGNTPAAVVIGFGACLVFVFLTIPAAVAAKLLYQVSLADSDWLHGSAESTLAVANLALVLAFREALLLQRQQQRQSSSLPSSTLPPLPPSTSSPPSSTTTTRYIVIGCSLAILTALAPSLATFTASGGTTLVPDIHAPYLTGFLDLPPPAVAATLNHLLPFYRPYDEPINGLTVATWIIHIRYVRAHVRA